MQTTDKKLLSFDDLHDLGIRYHKTHLQRLIAAGRFPAPVKLGEGKQGAVAFCAAEVQQWIDHRLARYRVTYARGRS